MAHMLDESVLQGAAHAVDHPVEALRTRRRQRAPDVGLVVVDSLRAKVPHDRGLGVRADAREDARPRHPRKLHDERPRSTCSHARPSLGRSGVCRPSHAAWMHVSTATRARAGEVCCVLCPWAAAHLVTCGGA